METLIKVTNEHTKQLVKFNMSQEKIANLLVEIRDSMVNSNNDLKKLVDASVTEAKQLEKINNHFNNGFKTDILKSIDDLKLLAINKFNKTAIISLGFITIVGALLTYLGGK